MAWAVNAWRIGRVGRTEVLLHPASLLLGAYLLLIGQGMALVCGTVAIILHEGAHAACAALLGWAPQRMELTPLGALLCLDDERAMPPPRQVLMLAAGPAASFGLCMAALAATQRRLLPVAWGRCFFLCNLAIMLVNLLPALPLDGGRLLSVLLGCFLPRDRVGKILRAAGKLLGLALIAVNVAYSLAHGGLNLSLSFAGCFLLYAADAATISACFAQVTDAMARRALLEKQLAAPGLLLVALDACPLSEAVRRLPASQPSCIIVLDSQTQALRGMAGEQELIRTWLANPDGLCGQLTCTNRTNAVQIQEMT